jgi:hypothetical protein
MLSAPESMVTLNEARHNNDLVLAVLAKLSSHMASMERKAWGLKVQYLILCFDLMLKSLGQPGPACLLVIPQAIHDLAAARFETVEQ